MSGLVAGNGVGSGGTYEGMAPQAELVGYKVLDADGNGYTSDVIAALSAIVANQTSLGVDVINLSLGHVIYEPAATDPLVLAVEQAVAAGIVVVVSAGNLGTDPETGEIGYASITSPGNAPSAITVGAVDMQGTTVRADDRVTDYSSRGPTWYDDWSPLLPSTVLCMPTIRSGTWMETPATGTGAVARPRIYV